MSVDCPVVEVLHGIPELIHSKFIIHELVGKGAYGVVYKVSIREMNQEKENTMQKDKMNAMEMENNQKMYALKQTPIFQTNVGMPIDFYREVKTLKEIANFQHWNIVQLKNVFVCKPDAVSVRDCAHADHFSGSLFLLFDYVEFDLNDVIKFNRLNSFRMDPLFIKCIMLQLLQALDFLHSNKILHRDIKPRNVLISAQGVVKLADFGFARFFSAPLNEINEKSVVQTLWYRAPEVLLHAKKYNEAIDMWALGCLFAELFLCDPIFKGNDNESHHSFESDQMQKIVSILGFPDADWEDMDTLPLYKNYRKSVDSKLIVSTVTKKSESLKQVCQIDDPDALVLLSNLLVFDPSQRITAEKALALPYFSNFPANATFDLHTLFPGLSRKAKPVVICSGQ